MTSLRDLVDQTFPFSGISTTSSIFGLKELARSKFRTEYPGIWEGHRWIFGLLT
jgi:hypothetical protein